MCNMFFCAIIISEFESEGAYGKWEIIKFKERRSKRD